MTPGLVPMIAPDGSTGDIPSEKAHEAVSAGFKLATVMTSPEGKMGYIPRDRVGEAVKAGFKAGQPLKGIDYDVQEKPGIFKSAVKEVSGMVGGMASLVGDAIANPVAAGVRTAATMGGQIATDDQSRKADNRSLPYRAVAAAATPLGVNARGMEEQAQQGNWRGVLGTAVGDAAPYVAGPALARKAPAALEAAGEVKVPSASDIYQGIRPQGAQSSLVKEAAGLSPKVVNAVDSVFRASAPTGMNRNFLSNSYAAAGDLAEIGRKIDLSESKGGIINPDMRPRAAVQAINEHLSEMYTTERAPQIQRNADVPISTPLSADAVEGLKFLQRSAGESVTRQLAASFFDEEGKFIQRPMTVAEADQLAMVANKNLKGFQAMNPAERAASQSANRRLSSLKALDGDLSTGLNSTLEANGEPGLKAYERRYAGLSAVRDGLERRVNAVELQRKGVVGAIVKPVASMLTHSPSGIASASQAAVADVNIGRMLQNGFKALAESDLQPNRAVK